MLRQSDIAAASRFSNVHVPQRDKLVVTLTNDGFTGYHRHSFP